MPPFRQVESLKNSCKEVLIEFVLRYKPYIIDNVEELKHQQDTDTLSDAHQYILLWNLPDQIYSDIAQILLNRIGKLLAKKTNRSSYVEDFLDFIDFFLNKKLKKFSCSVPLIIADRYRKRFRCMSQLTHFSFFPFPISYEAYNRLDFSTMKSLVSLSLYYHCSDEIIDVITNNCPHLQTLHVANSQKVSDLSFLYLLRCNMLNTLNLYNVDVTAACLAGFLSRNQTLTEVKANIIEETFKYLMPYTKILQPLHLKKIIISNSTNMELMLFIASLCPNLKSLEYDLIHIDFTFLQSFKNLATLKLRTIEYYHESLQAFFQLHGSNLTTLDIDEFRDQEFIHDVMKYCPNLVFLDSKYIGYENKRFNKERPGNYLNSLQTLITLGEADFIEFILTYCKNIKTIDIRYSNMSHATLCRILAKNPLKKLEKISITSVYLEMKSARMLLDSCPKLKVINHLTSWKISEEELQGLKGDIERFNWDLHIS